MSTAHRPTWKAKSGGGGLRDGATAPPTLQHSSKDQVAHSKLKRIRHDAPTPDPFASFFAAPSPDLLPDVQQEHSEEDTESGPASGSDKDVESDEDEEEGKDDEGEDDEAELLAELEKIRAERKAKEAKMQHSNPLLSSAAPTTLLVKGRWEEEGVVFRRPSVGKDKETEKKRFINDTIRSDYHRSFIDRFVK